MSITDRTSSVNARTSPSASDNRKQRAVKAHPEDLRRRIAEWGRLLEAIEGVAEDVRENGPGNVTDGISGSLAGVLEHLDAAIDELLFARPRLREVVQ